jgi:type IV secretory pathway VirB4 component
MSTDLRIATRPLADFRRASVKRKLPFAAGDMQRAATGRGFTKGLTDSFKNMLEKVALPDGSLDAIGPARQGGSWADACFIHAIPGADDSPGVVVLTDGSLRQVVSCRGINTLLFDAEEKDRLANDLTNLINSIEFDIQIVATSRNLPVDEYLSRYQSHVNSGDLFLLWYAEQTDRWFRAMQEVSYIPLREFHIVVEYTPPDAGNLLNGFYRTRRRSVESHEEYVQCLERNVRIVQDQLRVSGLEPEVLNRRQLRDLIYQHLNPRLSELCSEAPPTSRGNTEACTLARSGLKIDRNNLWLDGTYTATQYLKKTPHETWSGWLVDLLCLNGEYTFSMFAHACGQDQAD